MHRDGSLDLEGTAAHAEVLIRSGISGLIVLGSLGENQSLDAGEKQRVMAAMREAVAGRIPLLSGVAENSLGAAVRHVREGEALGLDGFMVMPPMSYRSPDPRSRSITSARWPEPRASRS